MLVVFPVEAVEEGHSSRPLFDLQVADRPVPSPFLQSVHVCIRICSHKDSSHIGSGSTPYFNLLTLFYLSLYKNPFSKYGHILGLEVRTSTYG